MRPKGFVNLILIIATLAALGAIGASYLVLKAQQQHRTLVVRQQFSPSSTPAPSLQIISPAAGEQWAIGETHTIQWQAPSISPNALLNIVIAPPPTPKAPCQTAPIPCVGFANPPMFTQGHPPLIEYFIIARDVPNSGSYQWVIPTTLSQAYRGNQIITISVWGSPLLSGMSTPFTIKFIEPSLSSAFVVAKICAQEEQAVKVSQCGSFYATYPAGLVLDAGMKVYDTNGNSLNILCGGYVPPTAVQDSRCAALKDCKVVNESCRK